MRAKLIGIVALLTVGCATGPNPKPDPCIGPFSARAKMPCTCPGTLDPTCAPWLTDAKRKKPVPPAPPATR